MLISNQYSFTILFCTSDAQLVKNNWFCTPILYTCTVLGDPQGGLHRRPGDRVPGRGEAAVQAVAQGELSDSPGER